jgi:hypothetical protein
MAGDLSTQYLRTHVDPSHFMEKDAELDELARKRVIKAVDKVSL